MGSLGRMERRRDKARHSESEGPGFESSAAAHQPCSFGHVAWLPGPLCPHVENRYTRVPHGGVWDSDKTSHVKGLAPT